jgi:hypothetical protein
MQHTDRAPWCDASASCCRAAVMVNVDALILQASMRLLWYLGRARFHQRSIVAARALYTASSPYV